ncbi:RNA polymerase sigma factor [Leifsonia sp. SIMBA_070]|uniref:RNA polymerase sigma factor n=1 Tax=Leifsonia sp. SIMBA_070 TaxID=3085810 RepID=UPI00397C3E50
MGEPDTDAALWLEVTSGTEGSFAVLLDRHRTSVFGTAYAHLKSAHDADDVVAMVFLEAWKNRDTVCIVDGSVLPWLLSVTDDVLLKRTHSTRRWRRLLADLPESEEHADHSADVRTDAVRDTLLTQVRTESSRQRHAVRRRSAIWGGIGLLVIGGAATPATAIVRTQPVTDSDIVYCLASPHRGADGSSAMPRPHSRST